MRPFFTDPVGGMFSKRHWGTLRIFFMQKVMAKY
jgi:hypothetical protein